VEVKIINENLEDFGRNFKVRRMNYDNIVVNYPTDSGMKSFSFNDVECISENDIDEFLIKNRNFLKIKLKRGISVVFYNALYDSIKYDIKEEIENLSVIKDKYKINKRGIWEKEILLIINNKFPLEVMASGQNFKKSEYNIIINELEKDYFLEICYEEIKKIESEIELKNEIITGFRVDVEQFKNANIASQQL
jgi:hypothetical protein